MGGPTNPIKRQKLTITGDRATLIAHVEDGRTRISVTSTGSLAAQFDQLDETARGQLEQMMAAFAFFILGLARDGGAGLHVEPALIEALHRLVKRAEAVKLLHSLGDSAAGRELMGEAIARTVQLAVADEAHPYGDLLDAGALFSLGVLGPVTFIFADPPLDDVPADRLPADDPLGDGPDTDDLG